MRRAKRQNAQTNPSGASVEFRDPERHQWHFFLRSSAATSGANDAALPESFKNALNAAEEWLGWQKGTLLRRDLRPAPANYTQRLVAEQAAEWHQHDGTRRTLEARTLLDACYLQLGAAIEDALQSFHALQNAFPAIAPGADYLGVAECWCLMRTDGDPDEPALREAIQQLALPQEGYLTFATQGGLLALHPETLTVCILYASAQTQPMSNLLHGLLPAFMLNLLKIRRLREQYLEFKPEVAKQETKLENLMEQVRQAHHLPIKHTEQHSMKSGAQDGFSKPARIEHIEQHSIELTQQQTEYLEKLSKIEEWAHTVETTRDNLRRLLRDPLWLDGESSEPARRLLEPVQQLIDQMRSDLHYFHITRQQADLHLQSLNTASGVRIAQWNRRITLLLGIFVVLELPQAFPELSIPWRLALIAAGALVLILGNWYFTRR